MAQKIECFTMLLVLVLMLSATAHLVLSCPLKDHERQHEEKQQSHQDQAPQIEQNQQQLEAPESNGAEQGVGARSERATVLLRHTRSISGAMDQLQTEDAQALKRQLPELIAQAHNDKSAERILLRMLINASQQGNLQQRLAPSQVSYNNNNNLARLGFAWQAESVPEFEPQQQVSAGFSGRSMLANLEQALENYGGWDNTGLTQDLTAIQPQQQAVVAGERYLSSGGHLADKREYLKPCSFNMISCAKNPFHSRKL